MTLKSHRIVSLSLAVIFLLAACAPAPVTPSLATPPQDEVATAVAATISAILTGTAAAIPSPTATLETIPTETPIIPTATPFVIATSTSFSSGGGGGGVKPKYSCDVIRQRPYDNQTFHPGDDFDVKWTLLNTGTAIWPAGTDFSYLSGPQMTGATFLELPQMKPGAQYSMVFDAKAPMEKGHHVMTWKVQGGFCFPYIAINVD